MKRAVRERLEDLEKSVRELRGLTKSNHLDHTGELRVANIRLNGIDRALATICPHPEFTCVGVRTPEAGWLWADFKCTACGSRVQYEAGPGSKDDMPPRFREIIGVAVPEKAEG